MRIDHLVYAVPELHDAIDDFERQTAVRPALGGKHTGLGTHNALVALGSGTYLELIAPDPEQPEPSTPRPFGADEVDRPRLTGWAITCSDIDQAIRHAREHGYDPGEAIEMQRATPDGGVLRWRLTLNAVAGGPVPFLIDWGDAPHPASTAPPGLTLERFTVETPHPDTLGPVFRALDVDAHIVASLETALVAVFHSPRGAIELR